MEAEIAANLKSDHVRILCWFSLRSPERLTFGAFSLFSPLPCFVGLPMRGVSLSPIFKRVATCCWRAAGLETEGRWRESVVDFVRSLVVAKALCIVNEFSLFAPFTYLAFCLRFGLDNDWAEVGLGSACETTFLRVRFRVRRSKREYNRVRQETRGEGGRKTGLRVG